MSIGSFFRRLFGSSAPEKPSCVACGSVDLEVLAPDTYRCSGCAHEGGDGYPAYVAGRETERLIALPADKLRAHAIKRFESARLALVGVAGELGAGGSGAGGFQVSVSVSMSGAPSFGGGGEEPGEREQRQMRIDRALGEMFNTRPILAALVHHGVEVSQDLAELDRLQADKRPSAGALLQLCVTVQPRVEAWQG